MVLTACVDDLSDEIKKQNNWFTHHGHGINHLKGKVDLKVFHKTLEDISLILSHNVGVFPADQICRCEKL